MIHAGLTLATFQCSRCGQLWEFKRECVGHQDWDEFTYKVESNQSAV